MKVVVAEFSNGHHNTYTTLFKIARYVFGGNVLGVIREPLVNNVKSGMYDFVIPNVISANPLINFFADIYAGIEVLHFLLKF